MRSLRSHRRDKHRHDHDSYKGKRRREKQDLAGRLFIPVFIHSVERTLEQHIVRVSESVYYSVRFHINPSFVRKSLSSFLLRDKTVRTCASLNPNFKAISDVLYIK